MAADWNNPVHYKPGHGAGLFLVHWRMCPMCRDGIEDPVEVFFKAGPSEVEVANFRRLWPLLINDMLKCGEYIYS